MEQKNLKIALNKVSKVEQSDLEILEFKHGNWKSNSKLEFSKMNYSFLDSNEQPNIYQRLFDLMEEKYFFLSLSMSPDYFRMQFSKIFSLKLKLSISIQD